MNDYNLFARIATIVENQSTVPTAHELYTIKQEHADILHKLKQKFYRFLNNTILLWL